MALRLDDLAALDQPLEEVAGRPMLLQVDRIQEDPEQPRREFDANALEELATTIRERGVRQPVSVRPDLARAEWWTLNFGARRLRAAKLAGLTQVPAFVDTTADSYDQVIENEQRLGLTPLELSLFVQKRLALGESQSEVARRMGKSRQYVTLATALIEPPDWLLELYRSGRCRGLAELYELRRLHGKRPDAVEEWTMPKRTITRSDLAQLRDGLASGSSVAPTNGLTPSDDSPTPAGPRPSRRLHVEFEGRDYQLVVTVSPDEPGCFYLRPLNGGSRLVAKASSLRLRGFVGS